jgi:dihydrodipicolinate synthase/N-acetylneuraminate lyase
MEYTKREAKAWAREHMKGVCNVIMPTFTGDLKSLNEQAIRHDIRREIELGFWGALVVSECGTTHAEYRQFLEIVIDEAHGRLKTVVHTSFDTLEDILAMAKFGETAGADALLLAYPPNFLPRSEQDIYDFSAAVMNGTSLATIIFNVHHWNFDRISPAEMPVTLVKRLAALPNAVAIKCEGGGPGNGGLIEVLRTCGDQLLVSDPREFNSPAWVHFFKMQWMGTSNYEAFGDSVPRYLRLMHEGHWEEAMGIYWRIHPARLARLADLQSWSGASFIHRYSWKYQGWLNGFNGGPLRLPVMRLRDGATRRLYDAFRRAGTIAPDTSGELDDFFRGRNPA